MSDAAGSLSVAIATPRRAVRLPAETAGWAIVVAAGVATAVLMVARGLAFDAASALRPLVACTALLAGTRFYRTVRPDERIATSLAVVAQLLAATAVIETLSYTVATFDRSFWDKTFTTWDEALGLDWRAYLAFVAGKPWLAAVCAFAYKSLIAQVIAAPATLGLTGRLVACRVFAVAFIIGALVTVAVSAMMPAISAFAFREIRPTDFPAVDSIAAFVHLDVLRELRSGALHTISLTDSQGIITFPSFHAALGVLFILAFWPLRWLRWPAVALNALLIAATPVIGGHYFVDVIAGVVVAVAAMVAARWLDARFGGGAAPDGAALQP